MNLEGLDSSYVMYRRRTKQLSTNAASNQPTWGQHLADFRAKNPHLKGADVMKGASLTYKKPSDDYEKCLTNFLKEDLLGCSIIDKYGIPNTKLQLEAKQIKEEIDACKTEDLQSLKEILCNHMDYGFFSSSRAVGFIFSVLEDNSHSLIKKLLDAYHGDGGAKYANPLDFSADE